jgi:hypothetical protein
VTKKKKSGLRKPGRGSVSDVLRMIANPCSGPTTSVYSDYMEGGVAVRTRSRIQIHATAANCNGFLLWDPNFFNGGADGTQGITGSAPVANGGGNLFLFESSGMGAPTNSAANPFGGGTSSASVGGRALADPAYAVVSNGVVGGARLLGACIKIIYGGQTSLNQGEFAFIRNLPVVDFIGVNANAGVMPSLSTLFTYASDTARTASGMELKFQPDEISEPQRGVGALATIANSADATANGADTPLVLGVPTINQSQVPQAPASKMFGLVWTGLNTAALASDITIELTKVFQYQLRPISGLTEPPPAGAVRAKSQRAVDAVRDLNKKSPGWDLGSAMSTMQSLGANVANMALAGVSAFGEGAARGMRGGGGHKRLH